MLSKVIKPRHILSFILILSFSLHAFSQSIEGDWYGKADIQGMQLRINVHVNKIADGYTSTWDSPDQGAMGIPSTTTTFNYPDFSFTHAGAGLRYVGKVNSSYTEITGKILQNGTETEVNFSREQIKAAAGSLSDLQTKYDKKEVYITMRDGVKLFTSIYTPKDTTSPHPVLINRTPYNIEPGGPGNFNFFMQAYARYTTDNYIMVFQDVRGRYMSEGKFEDIRPVIPEKKSNTDTDESTDTWDTVDWLIKNVKGHNGNVGIFGISYPGFYSTMGIIGAHPAVKAVSPQAPVTAWFIGDDFHHNGAFFLLDCFEFYYSFGHDFKSPSRRGFPRFTWPSPDSYEFLLDMGAIKNITAKYFGDSVKFWNDAFSHPNYDEFWKARDPRQYLKNVKPAVMTVGGWFDAEDLYGALHTYKAIEQQNPQSTDNMLVMGPWFHSQWAAGKSEKLGNIYWGMDANKKFHELEKKFFDYYLAGKGAEEFPEAEIFITGSNEWRGFTEWPPKNAEKKNLYLMPSGGLSYSTNRMDLSADEYVSDPWNPVPYTEDIHQRRTTEYMTDDQRFASRRPDVMEYQTDILNEDVTLTGPLTADLFVSTTGTDADYIVKLVDVFPDSAKNIHPDVKVPLGGYQMLVRGEVFRGRYRNSFEKPEAFTPSKVTEVKYELPDVAHTFKKGHRIMVQVQNSWFPLVDRNPQKFVDIYHCSDSDFRKATMRIYHDTKYPSHLQVNVLK
ncbi:MAG TPA: CocE/NonD family hydrolase [Bacteroidales bacterium]|nr:CocE/NonD family hydrolase [Bacteroidales bacterium]